MEDTKKLLEKIGEQVGPILFLAIIADGINFGKKAEKFEKELNAELDLLVEEGKMTEHEARWKFHADFTEFTENSAEESAKRIMNIDAEEEDNDPADEVDSEEETGEETNVDPGDPSGSRCNIDIHIHNHCNDRE